MPPAHRAGVRSDLDRSRPWYLGRCYLDLRTDRDENAIPTPGDKTRMAHSYDAFRGVRKRARPQEDDLENRGHLGKWIFCDLWVSWYPAHLTIARTGRGSTFHRATTRSAHGAVRWGEVPFGHALYYEYPVALTMRLKTRLPRSRSRRESNRRG